MTDNFYFREPLLLIQRWDLLFSCSAFTLRVKLLTSIPSKMWTHSFTSPVVLITSCEFHKYLNHSAYCAPFLLPVLSWNLRPSDIICWWRWCTSGALSRRYFQGQGHLRTAFSVAMKSRPERLRKWKSSAHKCLLYCFFFLPSVMILHEKINYPDCISDLINLLASACWEYTNVTDLWGGLMCGVQWLSLLEVNL